MTPAVPTVGQIRSQVATVLGRWPEARAFAIHYPGAWAGPTSFDIRSARVDVTWCPSSLAVRDALASRAEDSPPLVLLTDRPEAELGADVLARLAKRRVHRIDPWQVLEELFRASGRDPRLGAHRWLAEALIDAAPPEGYPAVPSGILDAETAWSRLYEVVLGIPGGVPDMDALLEWSLDAQRVGLFQRATADVRGGLSRHLADTVSAAVSPIFTLAENGRADDAVSLGIVVGALLYASAGGEGSARDGLVRLEALLGGQALDELLGAPWAASAQRVVRRRLEKGGYAAAQPFLERAEALLVELRVESVAWASDLLLRGLEQRLSKVGARFAALLGRSSQAAAAELSRAVSYAGEHRLLAERPERARALAMAMRLVRWLGAQEGASEASSFADAVSRYSLNGGHADWARTCVAGGESAKELARSYETLLARAGTQRERENLRFGRLLADWLRAGSGALRVVPVEDILDRVVAPLAQAGPVLVVVIDGMSQAVFAEIFEDLQRRGWAEFGPGSDGMPLTGVAALPTVTEVSRTSLLCGRLTSGGQAEERAGFSAHPALARASKSGHPPILYHKSDVSDSGTGALSGDLLSAIESSQQRVVGVVLNAMDDFLLKGDQILPQWSADYVRPLPWLLDAAAAAGRTVILTADHGHVLDRGMELQGEGAAGARFRTDSAAPGDLELTLSGPRVVAAGQRIVAPWSERIRYGARKNGYHGGASPQEVVVPLAALTPARAGAVPDGWSFLPSRTPAWWDEGVVETSRPVAALPAKTPETKGQLPLPVATPEGLTFEWIERLLSSSAYVDQKRLGGRLVPEDGQVREVLVAIAKRSNRVTRAALARDLALPELRLQSLLSALRRLLNLDGYPVISIDESSETVVIDRGLLDTQFLGAQ